MTKSFAFLVATALTVCLPGAASAGSVALFPDITFKPVPLGVSNGNGAAGFYDTKSYDSWTQGNGTVASPCTIASLIGGSGCDWKGLNLPGGGGAPQEISIPGGIDLASLQYLAKADGSQPNIPDNFYFTGPWALDFAVLFQLSAWDDTVEFGWDEAGNPDNRTSLLPKLGNPPGPYSANDGTIKPEGAVSAQIPGKFGFYYRNTRYGSAPDSEILFFTESRFNRHGNYFGYFSDPESGLHLNTVLPFDDESFDAYFDLHRRQQFALLTDDSGRFWLGLEDQYGSTTHEFCDNRELQPCSDYDFNDLIIRFSPRDEGDVPEPATLTMLGAGLLAAAWVRRRLQ